ncbi:MAG: hypothetical protein Q7I97_06895 [Thermovirgaceae bacterium]|nr:hypothetical protein [Thermovirgaceae bacterium]
MTEEMSLGKIENLLGLALKAGLLIKGQDSIRRELRKGSRLLILLTSDHSRNVASMLEGYRRRGRCKIIVLDFLTRTQVEEVLSMGRTQILGLPLGNGLTSKIEMLVTKGVAADEQDQDI